MAEEKKIIPEETIALAPGPVPFPTSFAPAPAEKEGPLFVSLSRFNEIKADVEFLRDSVTSLRSILEDMKDNAGQSNSIIGESSSKVEDVEERAEKLSRVWMKRG